MDGSHIPIIPLPTPEITPPETRTYFMLAADVLLERLRDLEKSQRSESRR